VISTGFVAQKTLDTLTSFVTTSCDVHTNFIKEKCKTASTTVCDASRRRNIWASGNVARVIKTNVLGKTIRTTVCRKAQDTIICLLLEMLY
jgi:hypothetical protein